MYNVTQNSCRRPLSKNDELIRSGVISVERLSAAYEVPIETDTITSYEHGHIIGTVVEVWECISYLIPHFIMDAITYPCWDKCYSTVVDGPHVVEKLDWLICSGHDMHIYFS